MADHQRLRIHPMEGEAPAPPTTPLVPPGSSRSEKGIPLHHPPLLRSVPAVYSKPRKRSCFCKCMCWTISVFVLLLIILAAIVGILYLVFKPKLPDYSVDTLRISDLRLNFDMSLYAKFDVKITANNPNKKIGIYYEKGGKLSVWYTNTRLCEGSLPQFYQGHQNKTVLDVSLSGQVQSGSTLMTALQQQQQTGRIPLDLKVHAPIAIKLGRLKLMKIRVLGECLLVVDSLSSNNLISIKASNCKFRMKL
ncbi:Late embryogenesis abundant protein [Vigna unguiculata]|uniref:Late embryogenesis abundant protein n=1 Tax=Vigna unguiculata TaxID=3917 RepID=A0A4D6N4B0_VIGUN|nr:Late embryogenesis abundant protein [Vigna unguiculata]